ncbi:MULTISPECIES: response regulator [Spirosoma]|uniref:Response regulator transcription factor n=1 Tax=Spirosoma liriopis TaxID=2937440 RepID=A0ABT0HRD2_9BACT|nr:MULTISPECIES: response regulator transcription factor [Spirosoma]MCK8494545.1 response regulator transcription factor [Spirosoma liriopis]UHG89553.1 response regulator transcription factor [Spirosoma oryzicola]
MTDIGIIYYEDNRELREGLSFLIQATPGLTLLGAFGNCQHLPEEIRSLRPDVVLMDIDLPGISGIEAVPMVKAVLPATQVLMLTVFDDEDKIFRAIRNGASGYLLKHTSPAELVAAIFDLHRGGSPMTASIARKVLLHFQQPKAQPSDDYKLSVRELDIVKGLVSGYSYKLIADELHISIDTVRSHIRSIYDKLQVNSKTEAVLKAMREGLV